MLCFGNLFIYISISISLLIVINLLIDVGLYCASVEMQNMENFYFN
jgi:hypothetical protein